jgi:hypothetical protein
MTTPTIKSNFIPRQVCCGFEFIGSDRRKLREQFDYLNEEEFDQQQFFNYKNYWYCFDQIMRLPDGSDFNTAKFSWDGFSSDSYFSGILVKMCDDNNQVIVGRYYS